MRWRPILLITAIVLTALAVTAIVVLETYDFNRFKPFIARTVREATGRRLAIDGDIDIDWGLYPGISIQKIRFENAGWGTQPEMLRLEALGLHFSLLSLVFGPVEIHDIILEKPELLLETGPNGSSNLTFGTPAPSSDGLGPPNLRIDAIRIENGRLTYRNAQTGDTHDIILDRVEAELAEDSSSADLEVNGHFNRHPVRITGRMARPLEVIAADAPLDMTIKFEGLETVIELDGGMQNPGKMSGIAINLRADGRATAGILELIGEPEVPELGPFQLNADLGGALNHIRLHRLDFRLGRPDSAELKISGEVGDLLQFAGVELDVSVEGEDVGGVVEKFGQSIPYSGAFLFAVHVGDTGPRQYRLDDVSMTVGRNDLTASVDTDFNDARPRIDLKVDSRQIDLLPLFEASSTAPESIGKSADRDKKGTEGETNKTFADLLSLADIRLEMHTGRIVLPDLILEDLKTTATLAQGQLSLNVDGRQVPDLEALTTLTHMSELGPFQASGLIKAVDDRLTLTGVQFKAGRTALAEVTASGGVKNLFTGRGFDLDFRIRGDNAAKLARYIVEPWPLQGEYLLTGRMSIEAYDELRFEALNGTLAGVPFDGTVVVDLSQQAPSVRIDAVSTRFNLHPLELPGLALPASLKSATDLGPLKARLNIIVPEGPVGLDSIHIEAGRQNLLAFELTGRVADILDLKGMDLAMRAQGEDLSRLATIMNASIPSSQPFEIRTDVKDIEPGRYHFSDVSASLGANTVSADIQLATDRRRPMLKARLDAGNIDLLPLLAGLSKQRTDASYFEKTVLQDRLILPSWPNPPDAVTHTDADVQLNLEQVIGKNFKINKLQGRLKQAAGSIAVEAHAFLMADAGLQQAGSAAWQDIGRIDLQVQASTVQDRLAIDSFFFQAGDSKTIALSIEGDVRDVARQRGLDMTFLLEGDDAAYLNRFYPTDEPLSGPFMLRGHMADPGLKTYRIDDLQLSISSCDLAGTIEIDLAAERPRFNADLTSRQLDLRPFLSEEVQEPQPRRKPAAGGRKLFSNDPLPLAWRQLFDMHLSLNGQQLILPFAAVEQLQFEATLDDGDLAVEPVSFTAGRAKFKGRMTIGNGTRGPETVLALSVNDYDVGRELGDVGLARNIEGSLNADMNINGSGDSIAEIMAGLNGNITLTLTEGRIDDRYIGIIYTDLSATLLKLLRPFGRKSRFVEVNCFVGTFLVQNGNVDGAMVLDTTETTLYSGGKIDLRTEKLNVTLKSEPKSGLGVKGLGRIGFSLSGLARPFKLGGTLANPNLAVDPTQTAFTFGKIIGGLALGPYGIALLFTDVSIDRQNPCVNELLEAGKETP